MPGILLVPVPQHLVNKITEMGVLVGYTCNFTCAHCITGREKIKKLTSEEIDRIISRINYHPIRSLLFVGGETSLYVGDINKILTGVAKLKATQVKITTNGSFAVTKIAAKNKLLSFLKLDSVQLSYDKFHAEFLPFHYINNLYAACSELGIKFSVILTIQSPLDVVFAQKLWKVGKFHIGIQKVLQIGKAVSSGNAYIFPEFDKHVLKKSCPNRRSIKYLPGEGFSVCCSKLAYKYPEKIIQRELSKHLRSRFYKLISGHSFREIADSLGVSVEVLPPECSHECNLCTYIFEKGLLA